MKLFVTVSYGGSVGKAIGTASADPLSRDPNPEVRGLRPDAASFPM